MKKILLSAIAGIGVFALSSQVYAMSNGTKHAAVVNHSKQTNENGKTVAEEFIDSQTQTRTPSQVLKTLEDIKGSNIVVKYQDGFYVSESGILRTGEGVTDTSKASDKTTIAEIRQMLEEMIQQ